MSDGIKVVVNSRKDKKCADIVLTGLKALGINIDLVQELILENNRYAAENEELKKQLEYNKGDGTPKPQMSDKDFLDAIIPAQQLK